MVIRKKILKDAFLAWGSATAGAAALAFALAAQAASPDVFKDIRIGERGDKTRIAFLCKSSCTVERAGDKALVLRGVSMSASLDLTNRSRHLKALKITPSADGARIELRPRGKVTDIETKTCPIDGQTAACVDIFFDGSVEPVTPKIEAQGPPAEPKLKRSVLAGAAPNRRPIVALRETGVDRLQRFASLAPPERLAPPTTTLAALQPVEDPEKRNMPVMRADPPSVVFAEFDFTSRAKTLLEKKLSAAHCNNAEATLQNDAWALGAMVDLGYCTAARGDWVEGDAILARILEYTPDNYEALVGRALIAEQAEEKSAARKYYQDALNALPPIDESKRIVAAMAALQ